MDAIDLVRRPIAVVEHQRQTLHMIKEASSEIPNQLLSGVGLQPPRREALEAYK